MARKCEVYMPVSEVASALIEVAEAIDGVARALRALGNGNASTPMGAIEALGAVIKESIGGLALSIETIAEAHREGG
jgi:hypothetical protein